MPPCFVLLHRKTKKKLFDIPITNAKNKVENVIEKVQPKIIDDVIQ